MKHLSAHISSSILEKSNILESMTLFLKKYDKNNAGCTACNIFKDTVVIGVKNSSHLTILRNYQNEIIKELNFEFQERLKNEIKKIKFRILVD
ncbi:MAG: hypothetical protein VX544_00480 [Pseudomonadota bacterium]|nr:hypothetical protein [Pseudomonadota bacterium]|tara:strand:+ start:2749 stop:3027 length:279 start_codon:yes stop_codon:yes gene_type:complete